MAAKRREFDDLVVLNDDQIFRDLFIKSFIDMRKVDCPDLMWKELFDATTPSFWIDDLSIQGVADLTSVLKAKKPPPFKWFLSLPSLLEGDKTVQRDHVLVYACCLQCPGKPDLLYIGSAFSIYTGCADRVRRYEKMEQMAKYVDKAIACGYKIVHLGALFWMKLDLPSRTPSRHATVLGLEAWATNSFWAFHQAETKKGVGNDHYLRHLCPSDLTYFNYDGLNSHSCLNETITPGPPGWYEGVEVVMALLEKRIEARKQRCRANDMALSCRKKAAREIAKAYESGVVDDIVAQARLENDEDFLTFLDYGIALNKSEMIPANIENGKARGRQGGKQRATRIKDGTSLLQSVIGGTLLWDADDDDVETVKEFCGTIALPAQSALRATIQEVKKMKLKLGRLKAKKEEKARELEGMRLAAAVKAGTMAASYVDIPVDPATGERAEMLIMTDEERVLMERVTNKKARLKAVGSKSKARAKAEAKRLKAEIKAGRMVLNYEDIPVDPKTSERAIISVLTDEQRRKVESLTKAIERDKRTRDEKKAKKTAEKKAAADATNKEIEASNNDDLKSTNPKIRKKAMNAKREREFRAEAKRLKAEIEVGRMVLNYEDIPVDPKTGERASISVLTDEQRRKVERSTREVEAGKKRWAEKKAKKAAADATNKENVGSKRRCRDDRHGHL